MRITAIKQQVKNPDRASIFIDGAYSVSLTLNELLEEKLKIGLEVDEIRLKKLKKRSSDGKLRARTLEWLLNRPHSERELRDYLRRKQADPDMINTLVEEMQLKKYQDDAVFARWFIDLRKRKLRSGRAIRAELQSKGVSSDIVSTIESSSDGEEQNRLIEFIKKKRHISRYQDRAKFMQYLLRQGYPYDLIKEVLDDA